MEINKPVARIRQANFPIVGELFCWELVNFSASEIDSVEWFTEEPLGESIGWRPVKGRSLCIEVPAEYQNRRLKTVFYFKDGRQIKNLSWPILSPTSTRPPQEVHPSADVAEVLHKQLENIEIALEELKLARKEFETIKEIPKKLEKLEKLRIELDQISSSQSAREDHLEAFRLEVMEQRKQNELTRIRQRDELEREWDQFQIEKTAFIEDSDLSAKVLLLNEVISEMEAAWDVFAKANQLKVRLSLQSLAQIRELVAQPLEQARQAQIRRLNTIGPKVSVCPICGSPTAASNRCRNRCFEED